METAVFLRAKEWAQVERWEIVDGGCESEQLKIIFTHGAHVHIVSLNISPTYNVYRTLFCVQYYYTDLSSLSLAGPFIALIVVLLGKRVSANNLIITTNLECPASQRCDWAIRKVIDNSTNCKNTSQDHQSKEMCSSIKYPYTKIRSQW